MGSSHGTPVVTRSKRPSRPTYVRLNGQPCAECAEQSQKTQRPLWSPVAFSYVLRHDSDQGAPHRALVRYRQSRGTKVGSEPKAFDRTWPQRGFLAAAARPMFLLAALWAAGAVALWQWAPSVIARLPDPLSWHIHEMTFGFGGAALAGYLCSAISSWTARAPIQGLPVALLALLWVGARVALLLPALPAWIAALCSVAFFWSVAALLFIEARRAGKGWQPIFIAVAMVGGAISGTWILFMATGAFHPAFPAIAVLGFAAMLIHIGGRMVPAFLDYAAKWEGRTVRAVPALPRRLTLVAVAAAAASLSYGAIDAASFALIAAGLLMLLYIATWPLAPAGRDVLLAILTIACVWVPVGLVLWGLSLLGIGLAPAEAQHALVLGAMGGHFMGLGARVFAHRTAEGLKARAGVGMAYLLILCAVPARMAGLLDLSAALWCLGWLGFALVMAPHLTSPLPRPVFSGSRL
ncbi:NnrS family protein [Roseibacterium beibuensis]|nr:NnrS family protein [Roseibacterium beibuensis]MCS6621474.1 NnrS family protein [Roseibacterium beibuensis]